MANALSKMPHLKVDIMARAVQTFDRASAVIAGVVWGAAVVLIFLAYLGVHSVIDAREKLAVAEATTPGTPIITQQKMDPASTEALVQKLVRRYGDTLVVRSEKGVNKISISAKDPSAFSSWLTAVTYLDIIRPDISWTVDSMCVGAKCKDAVMAGTFVGQMSKFELPAPPPPAE